MHRSDHRFPALACALSTFLLAPSRADGKPAIDERQAVLAALQAAAAVPGPGAPGAPARRDVRVHHHGALPGTIVAIVPVVEDDSDTQTDVAQDRAFVLTGRDGGLRFARALEGSGNKLSVAFAKRGSRWELEITARSFSDCCCAFRSEDLTIYVLEGPPEALTPALRLELRESFRREGERGWPNRLDVRLTREDVDGDGHLDVVAKGRLWQPGVREAGARAYRYDPSTRTYVPFGKDTLPESEGCF